MKLKYLLLLVLVALSVTGCEWYDPAENTFQIMSNLFTCGLLYGTLTGIIPCVLILLVWSAVSGGLKARRERAETDYTPISPKDRRERMLDSLESERIIKRSIDCESRKACLSVKTKTTPTDDYWSRQSIDFHLRRRLEWGIC